MENWQTKTPVALIIFKRSDTTKKILDVLRQVKPPKLLVIADGPRADRPGEAEQCHKTRSLIDSVDWDCEILTNFSDVNLGCMVRPASGIKWVFQNVEEAIILEDDCLPDISFFRFCDELLERYRNDQRIMQICGSNYGLNHRLENVHFESSYSFSRYQLCWGWATWRRAWNYFDLDLQLWPKVRDAGILHDILDDPHTVQNWTKTFNYVYNGNLDCWDFQWMLASWLQNGLSIIPSANLISNIGDGEGATHDMSSNSSFMRMHLESLNFPLKHPFAVVRNKQADDVIQDVAFDYHPKLHKKLRLKLAQLASKLTPENAVAG
jgi:hypothetical protein